MHGHKDFNDDHDHVAIMGYVIMPSLHGEDNNIINIV